MKDGVNIGKWNLKEQIKRAEEIHYELEKIIGKLQFVQKLKVFDKFPKLFGRSINSY